MAEQVLGTATLQMAANIGRLQTDLAKANQTIQGFASKAKTALGGLATLAGASAFSGFVKAGVDAADRMADLEQRSGIAASGLAVLQSAAERGGASLEDMEGLLSRLPGRMAEFANQSSAAGKVLREMNVDPAAGLQDLPGFMRQLGDATRDYATDAAKAALYTELLGKGGDKLAPAIEGMREAEERVKRLGLALSSDVLEGAGRFNDALDDMGSMSRVAGATIGATLAPALTAVADAMAAATREGSVYRSIGEGLEFVLTRVAAGFLRISTVVTESTRNMAAMYQTGKALFSLDFSKAAQISERRSTEADETWRTVRETVDKIKNASPPRASFSDAAFEAARSAGPPKTLAGIVTRLNTGKAGAGGGGKSPEQQRMENEAAAARQLQEEVTRLASERVSMLDHFRDLDLVAESDYYATKRRIQDDAMAGALAAAEQEVGARQAALKRLKAGSADYETALERVREAEGRRADIQQQHARQVADDWFAQARAAREYERSIRELGVELADLEGQTREAAAIRFDEQHGDTVRQALDRGDSGTIERVGRLRRSRIAGAELGGLDEQAGILRQRLQVDEERIQNNLRMGAIGDIEAMRRTGALRQEAIEQLSAIEQRMREVAAASADPRVHTNLLQFQSDLERLRAEADVFGLRMREIGEGSIGTFFSDIVSGTKSVTSAFRDMVGSILQEMSRIVSRDIARSIMGAVSGAAGGGGGRGSGLAGILGTIGQAAIGYFQGGASSAGISTGGSYGYASAAALAVPARDRRALGGVVIAGKQYVVGDRADRSPEWFVPQQSGRIVTADPKRPDAIMLPGPRTAASALAAPEAVQTPAERMRRALGGSVVAGSPYIVGDRADRGREWFAPAQRIESMSQLVAMRDRIADIRVSAAERVAPRAQRALGGAVIAGRPYVVGDRADRMREVFVSHRDARSAIERAAAHRDAIRPANARALGGMVVAGQSYTVNEQTRHESRPEVFVPAMSGSVANKQLAGARSINVQMTVNARDAKSFLESESQVQASIARAANRGRRNL